MPPISFNSNIPSLQAQRRLTENTSELGRTYERLSSGLRVNRASDDAAGVAIASSLNVDSRVFTQGVRNLNDGIALLNVVEGSLSELRNIVFRLRELAEQSANGVLTSTQRQSIDDEGQALVSEYNRIIAVTDFNGLKLLDGTLANLTLQAGYGTTGELALAIGQQLQRNLGEEITTTTTTDTTTPTGTFQANVSYAGANKNALAVGDLNGDGILDIVGANAGYSGNRVDVYLGNGNGSFQARLSYSAGGTLSSVAIGDVNGDGKLDFVTTDSVGSKMNVLLGNGNGTFQARTSYTTYLGPQSVAIGELNGDGKLDIVTADTSFGDAGVFLGNGNGTFQASRSYSTGIAPREVVLQDFNGDGKLDILTADLTAAKVSLRLGNVYGPAEEVTPLAPNLVP